MTTTEQDIKIGDRVLCKHLGVLATVDHFGIHKGEKTYIVKHDEQRVRADGFEYQFEEYSRYGITKNYDNNGNHIVGNATYYREELLADWWTGETLTYEFKGKHQCVTVKVSKPTNDGSTLGARWKTEITKPVGCEIVTSLSYKEIGPLSEQLEYFYNNK